MRRSFACFWLLVLAVLVTSIGAQQQDPCYVNACADESDNSFFSYSTCCDNECCSRLRYWVYPASIAAVGFVAGAFFALCFQCR